MRPSRRRRKRPSTRRSNIRARTSTLLPEEAPQGPVQSAAEDQDEGEYDPATGHEDVLEDTPRFLEDAPEDDDLWFEQKPPKDFDLD